MSLVNSVERDVHLAQELHVLLLSEGFRSHIKQFGNTREDIRADLLDLRAVQRGIQEMRDSVTFLHESPDHIHLIFHQSDQRRDHNGCPRHHQSGQLEAQRLASARRHQDKRVLALQEIPYDSLLFPFEGIETEEFFQLGFQQ